MCICTHTQPMCLRTPSLCAYTQPMHEHPALPRHHMTTCTDVFCRKRRRPQSLISAATATEVPPPDRHRRHHRSPRGRHGRSLRGARHMPWFQICWAVGLTPLPRVRLETPPSGVCIPRSDRKTIVLLSAPAASTSCPNHQGVQEGRIDLLSAPAASEHLSRRCTSRNRG